MQAGFSAVDNLDYHSPNLLEIWDYLQCYAPFGKIADIQQGFQFINENKPEGREVISKTRRKGWTKAVLVNYAPVSGEPWRLKAVIDQEGTAVSSCSVVVRPKGRDLDSRFFWAVLNSPVANAYAYCFSGRRETLVSEWRKFPCSRPSLRQHDEIVAAAARYLTATQDVDEFTMAPKNETAVRKALLAMDAAVLRFYDLPPRLERQLLDLFTGVERKGVGCDFRGYYPSGLDAYVPLHELISEDYKKSLLGTFRANRKIEESETVLAALRTAAEAFTEE